MSTSSKNPAANRHHGGPGSAHQRPDPTQARKPEPGTPTNDAHSRVSGGGGERDRHHRRSESGKSTAPRSH